MKQNASKDNNLNFQIKLVEYNAKEDEKQNKSSLYMIHTILDSDCPITCKFYLRNSNYYAGSKELDGRDSVFFKIQAGSLQSFIEEYQDDKLTDDKKALYADLFIGNTFMQYIFITLIGIYNASDTREIYEKYCTQLIQGVVFNKNTVIETFEEYINILQKQYFKDIYIQFNTASCLEKQIDSLTNKHIHVEKFYYKKDFPLCIHESKNPLANQFINSITFQCGKIKNMYIGDFVYNDVKGRLGNFVFQIPTEIINCHTFILEQYLFNQLALGILNNYYKGTIPSINFSLMFDKYSNVSYKLFQKLNRGEIAVFLDNYDFKKLEKDFNSNNLKNVKYAVSTCIAKDFSFYTRKENTHNERVHTICSAMPS